MGATITQAGEDLIALKQGAQQVLNVTRFIFANVPGLDHTAPINRAAPKPPAAQIVHEYTIPAEHRGYVNPSQVVYSAQIGSDVGDWDFNWIGLETAEGVLFAVSTVALQQKRRNIPPIQVGNNLTRNFLVVFDGAQALTGITIDASTWQHDFTVRLAGIDERERQSNRDIYGRACFFGSSLQLEKVGATYRLKPGTAYIEGIRLQVPQVQPVAPPAFPTTAWLDVALQRELSDVVATWKMAWGAGKADYVDSAGVQHYLVAIAELASSTVINDLRSVEAIDSTLLAYINTKEPAITAGTTAHYWQGNKTWRDFATDVRAAVLTGLSTATSAAVLATDSVLVALGKLQAQVTGLAASKLDATANAVSATKLLNARAINGVPFDGTSNITVGDGTKLPLAGGTLTGPLLIPSGTAAVPSLTFAGDPDTGIYRSGTNNLAIATAGTIAANFDHLGNTTIYGRLRTAGALALPSWTTVGSAFDSAAAVFTDTSSAVGALIALRTSASFNRPTFASENAITVTDAATLFIGGEPVAGANVTLTDTWSLWIARGGARIGGNVTITGAVTATSYTGRGVGLTDIPQASVAGLVAALAAKAALASPAFTGAPTVPTPAAGSNNTQVPNTAWVKARFAELPDSPKNTFGVVGNSAWWKCGDTGLIRQFGVVTEAANITDYRSFPIAFPTVCMSLIATRTSGWDSANAEGTTSYIASRTQFAVLSGIPNGNLIYYEATGY